MLLVQKGKISSREIKNDVVTYWQKNIAKERRIHVPNNRSLSRALHQNLDLNENLTNPNNSLINTTTTSTLQPENPNNETTNTFVLSTNEENVTTTEENVINTTSVTTTVKLTTPKDLRRNPPPKKNSSNANFMSEKLMFLCLLLSSFIFVS